MSGQARGGLGDGRGRTQRQCGTCKKCSPDPSRAVECTGDVNLASTISLVRGACVTIRTHHEARHLVPNSRRGFPFRLTSGRLWAIGRPFAWVQASKDTLLQERGPCHGRRGVITRQGVPAAFDLHQRHEMLDWISTFLFYRSNVGPFQFDNWMAIVALPALVFCMWLMEGDK